jgi:hypothetical protein
MRFDSKALIKAAWLISFPMAVITLILANTLKIREFSEFKYNSLWSALVNKSNWDIYLPVIKTALFFIALYTWYNLSLWIVYNKLTSGIFKFKYVAQETLGALNFFWPLVIVWILLLSPIEFANSISIAIGVIGWLISLVVNKVVKDSHLASDKQEKNDYYPENKRKKYINHQ